MDFPTDSSRIVQRRLPLFYVAIGLWRPFVQAGRFESVSMNSFTFFTLDKAARTRRLLAACSAGRRLVALVRHRVAIRDFFELQPSIPQMEVICKPQHKPF